MKFIRNILKNPRSKKDGFFFTELEKILGFKPKQKAYYSRAFTHRSMNKKNEDGMPINYERLEFLGDAMLSAIIATYLFSKSPHGDEGYLTKMRSKIVSRSYLNMLGQELKLVNLVQSKIPNNNFGANIYGNLFEALIGAIYLDRGYLYCEKFVFKTLIKPYVNIETLEGKITSYKSLLIEWCQKEKKALHFNTYEDTGNDSIKHFSVKLVVDNNVISKGRDTSKKRAEEKASKRAFFALQKEITSST